MSMLSNPYADNDDVARLYPHVRPGYPRDLVQSLIPDQPSVTIADIGAGTGKLTGLLLALGSQEQRLWAVEPSPSMRAELISQFPQLSASIISGTAEATGLPTHSCDTIFIVKAGTG